MLYSSGNNVGDDIGLQSDGVLDGSNTVIVQVNESAPIDVEGDLFISSQSQQLPEKSDIGPLQDDGCPTPDHDDPSTLLSSYSMDNFVCVSCDFYFTAASLFCWHNFDHLHSDTNRTCTSCPTTRKPMDYSLCAMTSSILEYVKEIRKHSFWVNQPSIYICHYIYLLVLQWFMVF